MLIIYHNLNFHDFPGPTIKFHDFPGLKNEILKFHDFPGCQWPVRTLFSWPACIKYKVPWLAQWKRHCQGRALRNIEVSLVLRTKWCKIQGAQQMISMKNLTFSSHQGAKVRGQGSPGATRAQPWLCLVIQSSSIKPEFFRFFFQLLFSCNLWIHIICLLLKS